ncbi:hypothetical protein AGMMS49546_13470 [Spirochaetia bacterium]|nr:hypothetical protein AGMMS49546_13470 [Spirochaetia bacterium]
MTIEQTVEIPASHRLTIDVPCEVPTGPVILTFTPKLSLNSKDTQKGQYDWRKLRGIHKGLDTMEAYFERHWAENDRERAEEPESEKKNTGKSPLEDIPRIKLNITTQEIVELLRECRAGI